MYYVDVQLNHVLSGRFAHLQILNVITYGLFDTVEIGTGIMNLRDARYISESPRGNISTAAMVYFMA